MKYPLLKPYFKPKPRTHDPVSLLIAALSTGIGVATGSIIATATLTLGQAALKFFAISVILGTAAKLLAPKQKQQIAPKDNGYRVNALITTGDHAIIYGEDKVGGVVIFDEVTSGKKYLNRIIALAGHECEAITDVYFNDDKLTLDENGNVTAPNQYKGKAVVRKHLGAKNQFADSMLVSNSNNKWTNQHRAQGICYIYVRLKYNREAYPRGVPVITAKVTGRKVFDPRTNTRVWSDNAALCVLDYLTSDFGLGVGIARIDTGAVSTAANICDEIVDSVVGDRGKRYATNGSFTTAGSIQDILESLCGAMAGVPIYGPTTWSLKAGAYNLPTKSLIDNDLRSPISLQTRHKRSENFNGISGTFKGKVSEYKLTDYPTVKSAVFETEDGGYLPNATFNLDFTNTPQAAQRIAKIALYNQREQIQFSATFSMVAFDISVGDTIRFSYDRYGWVNKTFEVLSWRFNLSDDLVPQILMQFKETSAGIYRWNVEERTFLLNNTTLPDPSINQVPGISYSTELRLVNEKATAVLKIDVRSKAIYTDRFEVQYKMSEAADWVTVGTASSSLFEILDVIDGSYDIRARTITTVGIKSDWSVITDIPLKIFTNPPDDVTGLGFSLNGNNLVFSWDAVSSLDLSHYILRRSLSSGSYSSSVIVVSKIPRPATGISIPAQDGIYYISSIDKTGIRSTNSAQITVLKLDFEDWKLVTVILEGPDFSGSKSQVAIEGGRLKLQSFVDEGETATNGSYRLSQPAFDLGGIYNPLVVIYINSVRETSMGDLVDDLEGLIDDLQGLWDGIEFSDINVSAERREGDEYIPFQAGEFRGRLIDFRLNLTAKVRGSTPSISQITAHVYLKRRTESASGVATTVLPKRVDFGAKFHTAETVVAQIDNPVSGDMALVTARDRGGFTIAVQNAAGTAVARQISYVATGYGMEQEA